MCGSRYDSSYIESGYSSEAVSRSRAVGMWQFMRGTGRGYGLRVDTWVDERRDPVKATDAAARHLRDLRERFGSLYLAAAAYNAGAGKVSRSLGKLQWEPVAEPASDSAAAVDDESADTLTDEAADSAADGRPEVMSAPMTLTPMVPPVVPRCLCDPGAALHRGHTQGGNSRFWAR